MTEASGSKSTDSIRFACHIDRLCDQYEAAWLAGQGPRIEDYLTQVPDEDRTSLLHELLPLELHYRRQAGETLELSAYLQRFPELPESWLQQILEAGAAAAPRRHGSGGGHQGTLDHAPTPVAAEARPVIRYVGDYELLAEIARGGMGVVYKARQVSLNRVVAVKMILSGEFASAVDVQRFRSEAEAAAHLDHPHIVPIFEIGEHEGHPYFSMAYVEGRSLAVRIIDGPLEPREAAEIVHTVALAVQYAHDHHVIHRDLKPGNILLDAQGQPRVTDFGLAKRLTGEPGLTAAGEQLGTPSYMPPEQAAGKLDAAGPAADVYSLGAVLYAVLTARPPFQAASSVETMRQVIEREPAAPRTLNANVPRDLETIVLKCLEKSVARRYASAQALAEELQRFLDGRPILARPVTRLERGWRSCRRNPAVAVLSAVAVAMLLSVALVSTLAYYRESGLHESLQAKTNELSQALGQAQNSERKARLDLFAASAAEAKASSKSGLPGQRFDSLAAIRRAARLLPELGLPPDELRQRRDKLRDLAISCLALPDIRDVGDIPGLAFPDAYQLDRYVHRDPDGKLLVRRLGDAQELARLSPVGEQVQSHFAPDGRSLIMVDDTNHLLQRWELGTAAPVTVASLNARNSRCSCLELSRDGRRLLVGHQGNPEGILSVFEWPSGRCCWTRSFRTDHYDNLAAHLAPDGRSLAIIPGRYGRPESRFAQVLDADSGKEVAQFEHPGPASVLAWHPDGQTLAVGVTETNDIYLWNVPQRRQITVLKDQRGGEPEMAINATGELLASHSAWANNVQFWHPYTGKPILRVLSSDLYFRLAAPDGRLAAVARPQAGRSRVSVAEPSPVLRTLVRNPVRGPVAGWRGVSIHHGGRLLAVGSSDGVSLFDLETSQDVGHLPVGYALFPVFVPQSGELLTYSKQGLLRWPVKFPDSDADQVSVGPPARLPIAAAYGTQIAADPTGRVIAAAAGKHAFILHDDGQRVIALDGLPDCRRVAVSPDGRWVVTGNHFHGPVDVWEAATGKLARRVREDLPGSADGMFSPDGRWLIVHGGSSRPLRVGTWDEQPGYPKTDPYAFSADGKYSVGLPDGFLFLENAAGGTPLAKLDLPNRVSIGHATFTPAGDRMVLNCNDLQTTYVWDLRRLRRELSELELDWEAPPDPPAPAPASPGAGIPLQVHVDLGHLEPLPPPDTH